MRPSTRRIIAYFEISLGVSMLMLVMDWHFGVSCINALRYGRGIARPQPSPSTDFYDWMFGVYLCLLLVWLARALIGLIQWIDSEKNEIEILKGETVGLILCLAFLFLTPHEKCDFLSWYFAGFVNEVASLDWKKSDKYDPNDPNWYKDEPEIGRNLVYIRKRLGLVGSPVGGLYRMVEDERAMVGITFSRTRFGFREPPDYFVQVTPNVFCFLNH